MTRASKSLLISFSVLALVFLFGSFTVHSTFFHRQLLSLLRRGIGWNITIEDSTLNLPRGIIVLTGLRAVDGTGKISVQADRVLIDVSSFSLIRGKLIVTNLEVDNPLVNLEKKEPSPGPTPDFLTVLLPDVMNLIFERFERSVLLQNTILDNAVLKNFVLVHYGGKMVTFEKAFFRIAPNFFREIELGAAFEGASGMPLSVQSVESDLVLSRKELKINKVDVHWERLHLSFKGDWKGGLEKGGGNLEGTLEAPTVLSEPLTFDFEADVEKNVAAFGKIEAHLGKAVFLGKGSAQLVTRAYDLSFTANDLPLESIFSKFPSPILGPAKGVASVKGHAQGELPELKAKADATITDFHHRAMHSNRLDGTIDFHWPNLDFDADIKPGADGRVQGHAKGGVLFTYLPPFKYLKSVLKTVDVTFDGGSLQDILPTAKITGKLKGELHLKGTPHSTSAEGPGHAEVTEGHWFLGKIDRFVTDMMFKPGGLILFTKTEYDSPSIDPILWPNVLTLDTSETGIVTYYGKPEDGLELKGSYETKTDFFRIQSLLYRQSGTDLTGSLSVSGSGALDAKLKGTADLESVSKIPSLFREARGLARVDLAAGGTTREPSLRGTVDFQKDEIELRGFPAVEELEGRLTLDGPTVKPSLTGLLGDGRFQLGGSFGMEHFRPQRFDLTLRGTDLSYVKANAYRVDFDANLALQGTLPSPKLSGRIDIVDALYTKPFQLRELVLKAFEDELPSGEADWTQAFAAWNLDLTVKHSGDLRIRNNIADIYLLADLHVQGTYGHPMIGGAFTVSDGQIFLFGDTFVITEGRLEYIDPAHHEPYLTINAEEDLPPLYTVFVQLKGYLSNLEVLLSSTPALPREDVLSLITTGHTQEEIRENTALRQSLGMGVLAGELTSALEQPIARKTGLDVFRLEASESGQLSKLSLGKNVTDRLTLEFQSDFAPETAQRTVQANYYLTDNILLKGTRIWETGNSGTQPRFNFNISFRFRLF